MGPAVPIRARARAPLLAAWLTLAAACALPAAQAAVSVYLSPESLARRAAWILEGRVAAVEYGHDAERGRLATYVTLEVEAVHRGPRSLARVVLREHGGRAPGLVHQSDAVPVYRAGERVLVFAEPARDGALRTSGMFFGKFTIEEDASARPRWAARDLEGQGTILHRPASGDERFPVADLASLAVSLTRRAPRRSGPILAVPPEYERLVREGRTTSGGESPETASSSPELLDPVASGGAPPAPAPAFAPLSYATPARWKQTDSGEPVVVHVDRTGNPLGDGEAAAAEMVRAMAAWTDVSEARVTLLAGDTDRSFVANHSSSPARQYTGTSVILFDDPYDDVSDPVNCSGVLALGGYWRTTSTTSTVNGVAFHSAVQLYVIFNNDFECVLADADDLAEIAAHELGHGLGFGHSTAPDALMRSTAYRGRGPRLGDDDRDAAHCFYPHVLQLASPAAGESWSVGEWREIRWSTSEEAGPDRGTVDLQYSTNGGQSWLKIDYGLDNDGSHDWRVPDAPTEQALVRAIRRTRTGTSSSPFPPICSGATSGGAFRIVPRLPRAGGVPAAAAGAGGLTVTKASTDGALLLGWGPSCSDEATDYAVYEGDLGALRGGVWDPLPAACSTGGLRSAELPASGGDRYFLVAPRAGTIEGHFGPGADGALRAASAQACAARETEPGCD